MKNTDLKVGNKIYGSIYHDTEEAKYNLGFDYSKAKEWTIETVTAVNHKNNKKLCLTESGNDILRFKAIPLIEQWLMVWLKKLPISEYTLNTYDFAGFKLWINDGKILFNDTIEIKTVHRLQNLYYELTNKQI